MVDWQLLRVSREVQKIKKREAIPWEERGERKKHQGWGVVLAIVVVVALCGNEGWQ